MKNKPIVSKKPLTKRVEDGDSVEGQKPVLERLVATHSGNTTKRLKKYLQ